MAGSATYRVEGRGWGADTWTVDADTLTGTSHTVDDLTCATAYEVRVSAYGDGTTLAAAWGEASTVLDVTTAACAPPPRAPPPAVTGMSGQVTGPGAVSLDWDDTPTATAYQVQVWHGDGWVRLDADAAVEGIRITFDGSSATLSGLSARRLVVHLHHSWRSTPSAHLEGVLHLFGSTVLSRQADA